MARKPIPLAKLTCPNAEGLMVRERLFESLDQARRSSMAWVSGPAGAGKTSLLASYLETRKLPCIWYQVDAADADLATFFHYLGRAVQASAPRKKALPSLTPEFLSGLETFVRRYFRALFERFKPPFALVLDNFHDAAAPLHQTISYALHEAPPGINLLFLSRNDPPSPLARWYANSPVVGWDELKLTLKEAREFARHYGCSDKDTARRLAEAAQGWAAGLVLLLRAHMQENAAPPTPIPQTNAIYDYFAQEVFATIPARSRSALLKTALLPGVTAEAARQVTGSERAPQILAELQRRRFFVDRYSNSSAVYVYHPLFREFLLKRAAEVYSPPQLARLKRQAAQALEESGQIEPAVELLLLGAAWDEAVRLIVQQAPALIEQGRNAVLERWITSLPHSRREADAWLLYWMGISRIPFSPPESRLSLEPAFGLFKRAQDVAGMFLALGAVLISYFYEWGDFSPVDNWLAELESLLKFHPSFPSVAVEAQVALGMTTVVARCPQHRLLRRFKQRARELMRLCSEPQQKISVANPALLYCLWSGKLTEAGAILGELTSSLDMKRVSPADAISLKLMESIYAWLRAEYAEALGVLAQAADMAHVSGVHILDYQISAQTAWAALGAGDLELAARAIADAKAVLQPGRQADVLTSRALEQGLALTRGSVSVSTAAAMREVVESARRISMPFVEADSRLFHAQILVEVGEHAAARRQLACSKTFAREMPSPHILFRALMVEADCAFRAGHQAQGLASLRRGLAVGRSHDFINCHPFWRPETMARLFAKALGAGIEVDYVRRFIRTRELKPPSPDVEDWPWPIRIYALGRFYIDVDGQPLNFPGKVQKKPLALLKALLAQEGRGINCKALADQLWPDLEGDAGRNAFDLALHRLRKLLRRKDVVVVRDEVVALDVNQVWVDAWAFERLCGRMERGEPRAYAALEAGEIAAQDLLRLYAGHFLPDEDAPLTIAARERLRSKLLRGIARLGQRLERQGAWNEVTDLYRRAIELDPLAEEFHRRLILSYRAQGRIAEALDAYHRCRDTLALWLGVEPSRQTLTLYHSLKPAH
jgi:ATP/maltotriose-dependent transcriptional regulator MalT/DNA-binding SARP family transcriptional activator